MDITGGKLNTETIWIFTWFLWMALNLFKTGIHQCRWESQVPGCRAATFLLSAPAKAQRASTCPCKPAPNKNGGSQFHSTD